ncbi:MAG: glycosyltransferase family 2 protein [Chlorobium sp.]|uniref:glycosyltransferase family 2 protein n=1 Tax=Chlorobium sp. TaxID=1095 RepID=UPI002F3E2237
MSAADSIVCPQVDVIIPHYRAIDRLERCLQSLRRTSYPSMTIIVVDNGGGDPALRQLISRYPGARLLSLSENRGYSGGCNAGFRASTADFVVFMNDDTTHDFRWLRELVSAAAEEPGIAALQPKILSMQEHRKGRNVFDYAGGAGGMLDRLGYPWCYGRSFFGVEEDRGQYDTPRNIFWASGAAMLVRRSSFEEVGGFDDSFFMHMEEIDLCWRLLLAGYRIRSVPSSVVWHEGGASLAYGAPEKIYCNHRNNLVMLAKNLGIASLVPVLSARLLLEPAAALFYLMKGRNGLAGFAAVFRALRDFFIGLSRTNGSRRQIQGLRKRSDGAIFRNQPFSIFLTGRRAS